MTNNFFTVYLLIFNSQNISYNSPNMCETLQIILIRVINAKKISSCQGQSHEPELGNRHIFLGNPIFQCIFRFFARRIVFRFNVFDRCPQSKKVLRESRIIHVTGNVLPGTRSEFTIIPYHHMENCRYVSFICSQFCTRHLREDQYS